ncbi:MAG TPA: hypothetical protein VML50_06670, partial [Anaeromyxobacter sp.]|nr:hypothetical protein [Anaeromyxobacter sp.]
MPDLARQLVRSGVLPADAAARAIAAAHDGDVASAALRLGLAEEGALVRALADVHGCPGVDFSRSVVPVTNLEAVAPGFCRQRRVLPVSMGKAELVLAMADPEDYALADEIRFVTGRKVLRYVAVPAAIERALDGLVRERTRGVPAWRGPAAPALPDPGAAWVGVVHGSSKRAPEGGVDLPEITSAMEIVGVGDSITGETPFSAPTPARRTRPAELEPPRPDRPVAEGATTTVRLQGLGAGRLTLVADAATDAREEAAGALGRIGCT